MADEVHFFKVLCAVCRKEVGRMHIGVAFFHCARHEPNTVTRAENSPTGFRVVTKPVEPEDKAARPRR